MRPYFLSGTGRNAGHSGKNIMDMKRILIFMVAVFVPAVMFSQAQITTKKMKLEDFPEKIT